MNNNYFIRDAGDDDQEAFYGLLREAHIERCKELHLPVDPDMPIIRNVMSVLHRCVRQGRGQILLGLCDETPVAFNYVTLGIIDSEMYTQPAHRRHGLGTAMLAERENFLQSLGLGQSTLYVRPSNTRAIGLYRKLGYNFHSERGSEILIMTRPLQIGPQPLPSPL